MAQVYHVVTPSDRSESRGLHVAGRSLFVMLVLMAGLACGGDVTTTEPVITAVSVAGTWNLTQVDGKPLPFTYQAGDQKVELLEKQYVIAANGTFSYSYTNRITDGEDGKVSTIKVTDSGTESVASNVVTFQHNSGSTVVATVAGTAMTIIAGDVTQSFTRQ